MNDAGDGSREAWMHKALCLEAEISARTASNDYKQKQIDLLEEGLRQAKIEIARLRHELEFRRVTEGAASRNEAD